MTNDTQEIDLSPNELNSIRNAFPPSQLPLLFTFRSNIRYEKQSRPNSAVALSPHYIGLFSKNDSTSNFFSVSKLINIYEIINVYYAVKPFVVVETKKTKVTIDSKKSLHLAHLLYVIIKISFSYYPKKTEFIGDEKFFPPINFTPGNRDSFSPFISFPQQFQFTYAAECAACGVPYNHDVVRYINSMMLSANSIIDITQLPLDFSESGKNKIKNKQSIKNDDKKSKNKENSKDDDVKSKEKSKDEKDDDNKDKDKKDDNKKNKDKDKDKKSKKDKKDKKEDKKSKKKDKKNKEKDKKDKKEDKKRKDSKNKNDKSEKNEKSDNNKKERDIEKKDDEDETSDIYNSFDFSSIENTELVPIFKSLRYLEFANGVCCRNFNCPDILKLLHQLISEGKDIQIIHIENCGVTEGLDYLAHAIKFNADLEISYWNLSNNQFIDFKPFIMIINFSKGNLLYLNLNNCNISTPDSSELFTAMWRNSMMHNLKYLFISGMNFVNEKGDVQINSFEKYISRNGNIEVLDISKIQSEAAADILAIFTEKPNKIKTLIVSDIDFSISKATSYDRLLNFLIKTETLENIDISNTKLNPSQIETIISTIATNIISRKGKNNNNDAQINFKLSLGRLNLNGKKIMMLYRVFLETDMSIWNSLSFDENGMNVNDLKNLVPLLSRMKNLTSLSIGGNFDFKMQEIEFALPLILKIPNLTALYIAGNKDHRLKSKISVLLDKIYKMDKLNILDVSDNSSFESISLFVHILHSCINMKQFLFDGSDFSSLEQFENITSAIHDNKTIISVPFPINDAQNLIKSYSKPNNDEDEEKNKKDNDNNKKDKDKSQDKDKDDKDKDDKKKKDKKDDKKKKKDKEKDKKKKKEKEKEKDKKKKGKDADKNKKDNEDDQKESQNQDQTQNKKQETQEPKVKPKNIVNEKMINDMIKTLSQLQVTAITAINANRINQKMPNDLPFPATDEIQTLIQTISSKTRINIRKKNLSNYSCVSELLHLPLPFQNAGDVVRNGGVVRTINIGDLKQCNIKSMEAVIENKKPIDKMSTMALPTTMLLHFNTQFVKSSDDEDDESSNTSSEDDDDDDDDESSSSNTEQDTDDDDEDEDDEEANNKKTKKKKRKTTKDDESEETSDEDSDDDEDDDDDDDDRPTNNKKKANKKGNQNQNRNRRRRTTDSSEDSEDDRTRRPIRKVTNRKPIRKNSSSESETDSDDETDPSSSSRSDRRGKRKPTQNNGRRNRQQNQRRYSSDDSDDDDEDDDYVVRRKKPQKGAGRRSRRYSSSDESESESDGDVVEPWKSGLALRTRPANDHRLDGLVDTTYDEKYPKKKGTQRGGYAPGHFDQDTLDSDDTNSNIRGNRNVRNNRRTDKKVTFI